jgi:hypothetical protein
MLSASSSSLHHRPQKIFLLLQGSKRRTVPYPAITLPLSSRRIHKKMLPGTGSSRQLYI